MAEALYKKLPQTPGVYIMRNKRNAILYIGKAVNLYRRVSSYFLRPHDARIEKMVSEIDHIDVQNTESAFEALLLEAKLIKKYQPPYNIKEKDDTSFSYIEITNDEFPVVQAVRARNPIRGKRFGPFVSGLQVREALKIIRRVFLFNTHTPSQIGASKRPCLNYELHLCPGTCAGLISKTEYKKIVSHIVALLSGNKKKIIASLRKAMEAASKKMEFEEAEKLKRKIAALQHLQDATLIDKDFIGDIEEKALDIRIEGYDISHISGTNPVGSMVVFESGAAQKSEYKKFAIEGFEASDDVGMMTQVLMRRFSRREWKFPQLVLVDGGIGQVNAARNVLAALSIAIPVIGIAKGPERKRNDIIGAVPSGISEDLLVKVRDEAHRFAVKYHRARRATHSLE